MKCYTETIPLPLAEKLKEKGMPITITEDIVDFCTENEHEELTTNCTYAEVIDWFISKEWEVCIKIAMYSPTKFDWAVTSHSHWGNASGVTYPTWHEAAEKAIEKALTLI